MAGKKGRSGRKPRNDGLKLKPVALYIAHSGKTPITWFRFFKRIHGSRWQQKVRALMRAENEHAKHTRLWCCEMFGSFIAVAHTESSTSLSWLQYVAEQKFAKDSRETMSDRETFYRDEFKPK